METLACDLDVLYNFPHHYLIMRVEGCFSFICNSVFTVHKFTCKDRGEGGGKNVNVKIENFHPVLTPSRRLSRFLVFLRTPSEIKPSGNLQPWTS